MITLVKKEVVQILTDLQTTFTKDHDVVLLAAGGSLRDPICHNDVNTAIKDVDVCVISPHSSDLLIEHFYNSSNIHLQFEIVSCFTSYGSPRLTARGLDAVIVFRHRATNISVDVLIYGEKTALTPRGVLEEFDMDVCQVGLAMNKRFETELFTTAAFDAAIKGKCFGLVNRECSDSLMPRELERIHRMMKRLPHFDCRNAIEYLENLPVINAVPNTDPFISVTDGCDDFCGCLVCRTVK